MTRDAVELGAVQQKTKQMILLLHSPDMAMNVGGPSCGAPQRYGVAISLACWGSVLVEMYILPKILQR